MSFKQEFLAALHAGKDYPALLEIVRRQYGEHDTERAGYQALEQLWRELGFDEGNTESPQRDELEYLMERVWYFGANTA
ncbi:MAG TPA: hypothetical protein VFW33_10060 [Gemmataceae bacterium]|nr:hypothetical protein [Gemmataceae bacterium]